MTTVPRDFFSVVLGNKLHNLKIFLVIKISVFFYFFLIVTLDNVLRGGRLGFVNYPKLLYRIVY